MRRIVPLALLLCGLSMGGPAFSAALEEVVVEGTRLADLRQQIVAVEDRFYDLYTELNRVPEFDVHCARETRTGSRFLKRYCTAVFEDRAFAEEGAAALQIRQHVQDQFRQNVPEPIMPAAPPVQAIVAIEARRPAFRKHVEDIVRRNPELLQLLKERAELEKRYVETRRKAFGATSRIDER